MKKQPSFWTTERDSVLIENYAIHGCAYCAKKVGNSISATRKRAYRLGLFMPNENPWKESDSDFIKANYATMTQSEIAKAIGHSKQRVNYHAKQLKLTVFGSREKKTDLPVMVTRRTANPYEETSTGYIFRGTDHVRPQSALKPDNRTGRYTSLAY